MSDNKKLKSRRSSILKPPKPRNPLSDVDLNPPIDITIKSRRVSFANVHFKKEFTADPEKNTIWHNSYEEEMNKSDKSDFSDGKTIQSVCNNEEDMNMLVEDMSLDSDVMNCTHLVNLDGSLGHNSSDSSGVIDLTKHSEKEPVLPTIPKESENICTDIKILGKRQTINFIQGSEDANMNITTLFPVETVETFSQNKRKTALYNHMSKDEQNIEVTENISSNLVQNHIITNEQTNHLNKDRGLIENSGNIKSNLNENMPILYNNIKIDEHSLGKIIPAVEFVNDADNTRTLYFHSGGLDVTENIPSNINQKTLQQSLLPENKPFTKKRYTILQHQMNEEQNMNITENICAQMIAQQKSTVPSKGNSLRQTTFLNQLQEQNTEITQNICADFVQNNQKSKIQLNEGGMVIRDITKIEEHNKYKQSLDITEDISAKIQKNTLPKSQRQTILFKQMQDEEQNMEITHNIFTNFIYNSENTNFKTGHFNEPEVANVDITASVPRSLIQKINQQRIPIENKENMPSSTHRRTILYNQKENTEITENISTNILQNNIKPKNRQTIHFAETDMGDMDITENIPVNVLQKMSQKNIPVEDKENVPSLIFYREEPSMEMTQNVYSSRQTIHFKEPDMGNIDITESVPFISFKKQKLPVASKENICDISQIKSVSHNETQKEDVEITESMRRDIQNNVKLKDRHTLHFDDSDSGTIDITKSVPFSLIQKMSQQKLADEDDENMDSNSHTKLSYELQEEENMDVIRDITANIVQNSQKQKNRQTIHFNESNMGSIDITENVPTNLIQKIIQPVQFEHKQNICTNFISNSENKKSTCNISVLKNVCRNEVQKEVAEVIESINCDIENNVKLKDRLTINFDELHSGAMDITKSVPFSLIQKMSQQKLADEDNENMDSNSHTKLSYELQEEENMEVIRDITTNIVQNSQKQKNRQTIHFNESNMGSIDITENVPTNLIQKNIQPVQSEHKQNICTNFISNSENKKSMCNIPVLKNVSGNEVQKEEVVEVIESISCDKQNNVKLKDRQTINLDDSHSGAIDITKSIPFSLIQKLGQQKLPVEDEENMHYTFHAKLSYNETQEQNMEVEKNIATNIVQNSEKLKNRQTIHFNESNMETMDVTEKVSPNLVQKIIQPVTSEYTKNICTNFISNNETCSTIHYNETEMDNTEITENVPANLLQKFMQQLPFEGKEEQNECIINVTDALDLTPVNNQPSFNITANLTSLVDSTEKLINCKIGLPTSEYSKIITDNIDKNYSIVNTSIPENLDFSDVSVSDFGQKMDSIISVNSSTESVEHMDEWKKILNKVKPPSEIHDFDLNEQLAKLPPQSLDEDIKLLQSWVPCPLSIKERAKKYLNIDLDKYDKMKQETINFNVPQRQLEEENPNTVFNRIKKLLENKQQSLTFQKELTLTDKIRLMATKDKLWYLIPNTEFSFIFMKNIRFDVQVETNSEIVRKFCSTLDESKLSLVGLYIFEKLKPKLKEEKIKSCIGVPYTIFSFLDYLTQISEAFMDNINDFNDFTHKYGLRVEDDLNATLLFTNTSLLLAFEIKFNLNDLDHITADLIKINHLVCTADENALKRLVKFCPTGVDFIRAYHRSVSDYLKILQQSKLK